MRLSRLIAASAVGLTAALAVGTGAQAEPVPPTLTPQSIDAYLDEVMETSGVPGISVVVTHDDQVVHAAGYGQDSNGEAMTGDTPMRLASVSKSFTALAVMTLVEDGKISLDAPVAEQLPEFDMADPRAADITVRQLLNQTSGLSDTSVDMVELEDATSLQDYVAKLGDDGLADDPGAKWEYCNVNFNIAARLIEVAGGQSYSQYMKQEVFDPLGMDSTATRDEDVKPARGFNSLFGLWLPRDEGPGFIDDSGSGGIISSAADMGRWLISQNGKATQLLDPENLALTHTASQVHEYAMGWAVEGDGTLVHSGNLMTYNSVQAINPDTGYGVAVLTNGAGLSDVTYPTMEGLMAMSRGETPAAPGAERQLYERVLGGMAVIAIGLAVLGVWRSRRWAVRRSGRPAWRITLRFLPILLPVLLFATYPDLVTLISNGRTVTWPSVFYFALPLTVTLLVAAVAAATTVIARLLHLRSVKSAG